MASAKLFVVLILLVISSCEKSNPDVQLPNTVTANVNGSAWEKKACWGCIGGGSALEVSYQDSLFILSAEDNSRKIILSFGIHRVNAVGVYELTTRDKNYGRLTDGNSVGRDYYTNNQKRGKFTVTQFDLVKKTMSGTFEFEASDLSNPSLTVMVLNGNFNVKLD